MDPNWFIVGLTFGLLCVAGAQAWYAAKVAEQTRRYADLTEALVKLQNFAHELQQSFADWQKRVKVEARLILDSESFGRPGQVNLRICNLSAVGVWIEKVELALRSELEKPPTIILPQERLLAPNESYQVDCWTPIMSVLDTNPNIGQRCGLKAIVFYDVNGKKADPLIPECSFECLNCRASEFVRHWPN